ncbi:uncharacterized protein LOC143462229 [Clavelina lepadiformis]|uniref:2'-phosphotransferase n=1 Tax=Clavelina lepadiformis TaxID=159417 RepID=A0ABP0GM30_CLALP
MMSHIPGLTDITVGKSSKNQKKRDRKRRKREEEAKAQANDVIANPPAEKVSASSDQKELSPAAENINGPPPLQDLKISDRKPESRPVEPQVPTNKAVDDAKIDNNVAKIEVVSSENKRNLESDLAKESTEVAGNAPEAMDAASDKDATHSGPPSKQHVGANHDGYAGTSHQFYSSQQQHNRVQGSWRGQHDQQNRNRGRDFQHHGGHYHQNQGQQHPHMNKGNYEYNRNLEGSHDGYNRSHDYRDDLEPYDDWYPGDMEFSKELVRVLRHGKYKFLRLDEEGYISVRQILEDRKFIEQCGKRSFEEVRNIVDSNDKKRFELKEINGEWKIKATQGHTVKVQNLDLQPITNPKQYTDVYHGTYFEAWEKIKTTGLNRMKRNHIHFSIGLPGQNEVISGMRNSCEIVIKLDMEKAMKAGLKFFISSNKVILCEGDKKGRIHPKFFDMVMNVFPWQKLPFEVPADFKDDDDQTSRTKLSESVPRKQEGKGQESRESRRYGQQKGNQFKMDGHSRYGKHSDKRKPN